MAQLLDHLVGRHKQRLRHFEAERLRGVEVDDQLEFGRLHDWQVRWLRALEDATGIDANPAKTAKLWFPDYILQQGI